MDARTKRLNRIEDILDAHTIDTRFFKNGRRLRAYYWKSTDLATRRWIHGWVDVTEWPIARVKEWLLAR